MIKIEITRLAEILSAKVVGQATGYIEKVSIDSRQPCPNSVFFALRGENFDAHQYLAQAVQQGAVALVVEQAEQELAANVVQLVVADTKLALGKLAHWLREQISPKLVAMTGSSGKTTVKEMTAAILTAFVDDATKVLYTAGNFNNDIGVPLTLLRLTEQHQYAVIELGANHQGEISYTTQIACPDVALVNNVAAAHLEGFGSILGVAEAKGEIYRGLSENGVAIINLDCHYLTQWQAEIQQRKIRTFALENPQADIYAQDIVATDKGSTFLLCVEQQKIEINLPYLGRHNVSNALAAASLAMAIGADLPAIKKGLEQANQVKGRLYPQQISDNLLLLDDSYNANVDSLKAAIDVLAGASAEVKILVVGDMAELGKQSVSCHQQVAEYAKQFPLEVFSFGGESAVISQTCLGKHFTDKTALAQQLNHYIEQQLAQQKRVLLLTKGSRRMRMEEIIELIKGHFVC